MIKDLKFAESEFAGQDISSLPDRPGDIGITAAQLKARFDQIGKVMIAMGKFNGLIEALLSADAASEIGAQLEGYDGQTVQEILQQLSTQMVGKEELEKVAADLAALEKELDEIVISAGAVSSVNGKNGAVWLNADDVGAIAESEKGAAGGVAELDESGKVPESQLPGMDYVPTAGGEMTGALIAAPSDLTTAQVVNVIASPTDIEAGSVSTYPDGTICVVFE